MFWVIKKLDRINISTSTTAATNEEVLKLRPFRVEMANVIGNIESLSIPKGIPRPFQSFLVCFRQVVILYAGSRSHGIFFISGEVIADIFHVFFIECEVILNLSYVESERRYRTELHSDIVAVRYQTPIVSHMIAIGCP